MHGNNHEKPKQPINVFSLLINFILTKLTSSSDQMLMYEP
ncbi:hypothetical protein SAMN04488508_105212 [Aquimarina spongiae]|uniref:Uncharacterized protein n=1 Tax=Aquimarina spongiae TaxID=570521 RepID=A0A1M6GD77_9FLAO|nr:hypothetical protein SAMN04488508_105212 [Aquimarina spongiae]